jgi:hypothetical protein
MNRRKWVLLIVGMALYTGCETLHADIIITNKAIGSINVIPTFKDVPCNTHPCPGEIRILAGETGTISTKNKTLENIIALEKRAHKKSTMVFTSGDSLQNQDVYLTYENGELK